VLDGEQRIEQGSWSEIRLDAKREIQIVALRRTADGTRFIDRARTQNSCDLGDSLGGGFEMATAIAQVRAKSDYDVQRFHLRREPWQASAEPGKPEAVSNAIPGFVLGLTSGELFIVVFVTAAVVSAPWWLRVGELVATALAGLPKGEREDSHGASERDE
jgi:hypothetical protein